MGVPKKEIGARRGNPVARMQIKDNKAGIE